MRTPSITMLGLLALTLLVGCGGSNTSQPTAMGTTTTSASATAMRSPSAAVSTSAAGFPTRSAASVEVTGIVGTVNTAARTIQIDRRSGANVTKIIADATTAIRLDAGQSTTLAQIRPSDRIVARGAINDRGDALLAVEITVQEVSPAPAGG